MYMTPSDERVLPLLANGRHVMAASMRRRREARSIIFLSSVSSIFSPKETVDSIVMNLTGALGTATGDAAKERPEKRRYRLITELWLFPKGVGR